MAKEEHFEVWMPAVIMTVTKIIKKLFVREKKLKLAFLVIFSLFWPLANIQGVVCGI